MVLVRKMSTVLLLIYAQLNSVVSRVNETELLPYLGTSGSTRYIFKDNGCTGVTLQNNFKFLGSTYSNLYIRGNGYVDAGCGTIGEYGTDYRCNANSIQHATIAPYISDSRNYEGDETGTGKLLHRQDTSRGSLDKVAKDVRKAFPTLMSLRLTWMLIVTWHNIAPESSSRYSLRNTFQVVLTTDGSASFVLFYYSNITWPNNRMWPNKVIAGIFGGKKTPEKAYFIPGSCTCSMENIVEMSNIDVPGKFVFRVDEKIVHPTSTGSCENLENFLGDKNASRRVHFTPSITSVLGITSLYVHGITFLCLNHNIDSVSCAFRQPNGKLVATTNGQGVPGNVGVFCTKPDLNVLGKLNINVTVAFTDGNKMYAWGSILVVPELWINIEFKLYDSMKNESTLISAKWNSSNLDNLLDRRNFPFTLPLDHIADAQFLKLNIDTWIVFSSQNLLNNGSGIIKYDGETVRTKFLQDKVQTVPRAVAISKIIQFSAEQNISSEYVSDIIHSTLTFARFKISNPDLENMHDTQCRQWHDKEFRRKFNHSDALACPTKLGQVQMDWRFHQSFVSATQGEMNPLNFSVFVQSVPSQSGAGSQCAYNDNGELVLEPPYGSRIHRHSPSNQNKYWDYYRYDIIPFLDCCMLSHQKEENCKRYFMKLRKPYQPTLYKFPVPFRATGATQLTTTDDTTYLLNALGAFWLATYGDDFRIQVFVEKFSKLKPEIMATVITSAVLSFKIPDENAENKIQVSAHSDYGLLIWWNAEPLNFYFNEVSNKTGIYDSVILYENYFTLLQESSTETRIIFQNGISVKFCVTSQNRSLNIIGSVPNHILNDVKGLIGKVPENFLNASNNFQQLVENWRDNSAETILEFPTKTIRINTDVHVGATSNQPSRAEILNKVPVPTSVFCNNSKNCMVDYQLTNDKDFTLNTKKSYETFVEMANIANIFVSPTQCESPADIENGNVIQTGKRFIGSELQYTCKEECYLHITNVSTGAVIDGDILFTCVPNELVVYPTDPDLFHKATWVDLESWQSIQNFKVQCKVNMVNSTELKPTTDGTIYISMQKVEGYEIENAWMYLGITLLAISIVLLIVNLMVSFLFLNRRKMGSQNENAREINLLELEINGYR